MTDGGKAAGDPHNLQRFVEAQASVIDDVIAELTSGTKRSHWMWFIFPQLVGLGASPMAVRFAIASLDEASAYLQHDLLGPRLRRCTALVQAVDGKSASQILGQPDDLKFRSCMTLFARATHHNEAFVTALARFFGGQGDPATTARLPAQSP